MIPTTEGVAYAGAILLAIATLPQAVVLARTRAVGDFGWTFSVCNLIGLAFLAARSLAIQEWAFLAINVVTTAFWGMVVWLKVRAAQGRATATRAALHPVAPPATDA